MKYLACVISKLDDTTPKNRLRAVFSGNAEDDVIEMAEKWLRDFEWDKDDALIEVWRMSPQDNQYEWIHDVE